MVSVILTEITVTLRMPSSDFKQNSKSQLEQNIFVLEKGKHSHCKAEKGAEIGLVLTRETQCCAGPAPPEAVWLGVGHYCSGRTVRACALPAVAR